ncbi:hypothetical protein AB0H76_15450 [Nocardia sp. NPDC050712]|uniref:hypothetical protein n=1 Tax=Nocardia sp. NPDC050712 TaxID=3155518 RepID=UPI0033D9E887
MSEIWTTEAGGAVADWYDDAGVIRVRAIKHNGTTTTLSDVALGQCRELMPDALWNMIRREHARDGDPRTADCLAVHNLAWHPSTARLAAPLNP